MMMIGSTKTVSTGIALSTPAMITLLLNPREPVVLITFGVSALFMFAWIAIRDMRDFIIPDIPLICIVVLALALRAASATPMWSEAATAVFLDAIICGGTLWLIREAYFRLRGYDGIGFGDVKLAAAGGMLIGTVDFAVAVLAASVTGITIAIFTRVSSQHTSMERLPFGALLGPACWLIWLSGSLSSP